MINSPIRKSYLTYLKDLSDLDKVIKMYELEQRREKESLENVKVSSCESPRKYGCPSFSGDYPAKNNNLVLIAIFLD